MTPALDSLSSRQGAHGGNPHGSQLEESQVKRATAVAL